MKPITISPISLVLGAVFAAGLFLVMGQAAPTSFGTWGPPKKGVVNLFEPNAVAVPANSLHVVYQVPLDRWLTVSAAHADVGTSAQGSRWCEVAAGVVTEKGIASAAGLVLSSTQADMHSLLVTPEVAGGTIGWVFRPGSQVAIMNGTGSPISVKYALVGYESRD